MAILPAVQMPLYLEFLPMLAILFALSLLSCCYFYYHLRLSRKRDKNHQSCLPTNWPVVGMLPGIFRNYHRLHDYGTEILKESGGTFEIKGPWLANADIVITSDPANVKHILSKNFSNYPRGPEFRKIFDILGDGIFNTDDELWEIHRKVTLSILHHADYKTLLQETVLKKLEKVLLPMLENFANDDGVEIDMQDIIGRFTFDIFSTLILDDDPGTLSPDLPDIPSRWGFNDAEKAILQRHILPESCWKLQKWLNFGKERKMSQAWEAIDGYIYSCIDKNLENQGIKFTGISAFQKAYKTMEYSMNAPAITNRFLRDVALSLLVAGKDTISTALTWFFFLVAKNPGVEAKILEEIENELSFQPWHQLITSSHKLVYLHGAICETLRLFPPVALEHRGPSEPDILPSGATINADAKIVLFFYSMGRMESIWGKDCLEFKPERWITEQGGIAHQPSFKFVAFNTGPRTCLGKGMTFTVMKMVIISVIWNYRLTLVDAHPVLPADSVIIHMKHGLKVVLSKKFN